MKIRNYRQENNLSITEESGIVWKEGQPHGEETFWSATSQGWNVQRERPSHANASTCLEGRRYHLKWFLDGRRGHHGRREWENAALVARLGVPTVTALGWGVHAGGSFVVLEEAPGAQADDWWRTRRRARDPLPELHALCRRLARHVAQLHDGGWCHRDLNVYHVLVHEPPAFRLIDVGRVARVGRWRPRRWLVKDLASLLYSARREGFPAATAREFLRAYLAASRRRWRRRALLAQVVRKSERYRRHNERKERRGEDL